MAVTLDQIDALDPGSSNDVKLALTFLRLVVRNNPGKSAADLSTRPDVQSALAVLDSWFNTAENLISPAILQSPITPATVVGHAAADSLADMLRTTDKLRQETAFTDANIDYWKSQEPQEETSWVAKVLLRMGWFARFLAAILGLDVPSGATHKTWLSRLAPNTCSYCRRLHGVTIPLDDSFAPYAVAAGFAKPYGGLYGPPLHPSCRCTLEFY